MEKKEKKKWSKSNKLKFQNAQKRKPILNWKENEK